MPLKSKYAIFERFNIQTLYNTFVGLQPKEQIIALAVTGVLLLLIVILPISLAGTKLGSLQKEITKIKSQMDDAVRGIADYNTEKTRLNALESLLRTGFDTSISTTIENTAAQSGIKENVDSIKERPIAPSEIYDEAIVDVRVSRVTLEQLIDFLYKVESERTRVLRVKQLQVKTRYDNRKLLDVSFQVSTFKLSS